MTEMQRITEFVFAILSRRLCDLEQTPVTQRMHILTVNDLYRSTEGKTDEGQILLSCVTKSVLLDIAGICMAGVRAIDLDTPLEGGSRAALEPGKEAAVIRG